MEAICSDINKKNFKKVYIESDITDYKTTQNKNLLIGRNVEFLLNNRVKLREQNYFREVYIDTLIKRELAARRSLIYQDQILKQFKGFWGDEFLEKLNCNYDSNKNSNWVSTITRKHRKSFHPIQHIIIH